jgi:alanyl-tRNA synthetase
MKKEIFEIYDSGIAELDATVTKTAKENSFLLITLDKTPLRPASGGQPTDFGIIENETFSAKVIDAVEKDGEAMHRCEVNKGTVSVGDKVAAKIDEKRRRNLTLMHSGEHLFFSCLKKTLEKKAMRAEVEKVSLDEEESTLFVKADSLNWYIVFEAEELANRIISEARDVSIQYAGKEALPELEKKGIRIKEERIKEGFIRVVDFSGADLSACTGTHVKNTSEILCFVATDFKSIAPEKYEIKFRAGESARNELFAEARIQRKEQAVLGAKGEESFQLILKILEEKKNLEEKAQRALFDRIARIHPEKISGVSFYSQSFEAEEQKTIVKAASRLCDENGFAAFVNRKELNKAAIYLMRSKEIECDLLSFFKNEILKKFPGKGGGNESYVTGEVEIAPEQEEDFFDEIRSFVKLNC